MLILSINPSIYNVGVCFRDTITKVTTVDHIDIKRAYIERYKDNKIHRDQKQDPYGYTQVGNHKYSLNLNYELLTEICYELIFSHESLLYKKKKEQFQLERELIYKGLWNKIPLELIKESILSYFPPKFAIADVVLINKETYFHGTKRGWMPGIFNELSKEAGIQFVNIHPVRCRVFFSIPYEGKGELAHVEARKLFTGMRLTDTFQPSHTPQRYLKDEGTGSRVSIALLQAYFYDICTHVNPERARYRIVDHRMVFKDKEPRFKQPLKEV